MGSTSTSSTSSFVKSSLSQLSTNQNITVQPQLHRWRPHCRQDQARTSRSIKAIPANWRKYRSDKAKLHTEGRGCGFPLSFAASLPPVAVDKQTHTHTHTHTRPVVDTDKQHYTNAINPHTKNNKISQTDIQDIYKIHPYAKTTVFIVATSLQDEQTSSY